MQSEREPGRYEPLDETHRRVNDEEQRRQSAVPPQHSPYDPLHDSHRRVAEAEEKRRAAGRQEAHSSIEQSEPEPVRPGTEARPSRPEIAEDHEPDSPEARLAEKERDLQERVKLGRISPGEMIHELRQFDDELRIEIEHGGRAPLDGPRGGQREDASYEDVLENEVSPQHGNEITDHVRRRDDPSERPSETRIEREAEAAGYEITRRGEMTDARAARLARLQTIDRAIEREHSENDRSGLDHGQDRGGRSL